MRVAYCWWDNLSISSGRVGECEWRVSGGIVPQLLAGRGVWMETTRWVLHNIFGGRVREGEWRLPGGILSPPFSLSRLQLGLVHHSANIYFFSPISYLHPLSFFAFWLTYFEGNCCSLNSVQRWNRKNRKYWVLSLFIDQSLKALSLNLILFIIKRVNAPNMGLWLASEYLLKILKISGILCHILPFNGKRCVELY